MRTDSTLVSDLGLDAYTARVLTRNGVTTLGDLRHSTPQDLEEYGLLRYEVCPILAVTNQLSLDTAIDDLPISHEAKAKMWGHGMRTLADAGRRLEGEMWHVLGFGMNSLRQIQQCLVAVGHRYGTIE